MTPQEENLITQLLDRLKQTDIQGKDLQAEALINAGVAAQPDAPYLLVQTVLIQNMTLEAAQARITELEKQLAAQQQPAPAPASFLGGRAGSVPASPAAASPAQTSTPAPSLWASRSAAAQPPAQPWGAAGTTGMGGAGGFLRNAAATAAGVAGGALLFQGISSLFNHGTASAAGLGGFPADASRDSLLEQQGLSPSDPQLAENRTPSPWDNTSSSSDGSDTDDRNVAYDNGGNDDDSTYDNGGYDDGGGFDDNSDI